MRVIWKTLTMRYTFLKCVLTFVGLQIISGEKLAHFQSPHRELKIPAKNKLKKRLDSLKPTYIYHT